MALNGAAALAGAEGDWGGGGERLAVEAVEIGATVTEAVVVENGAAVAVAVETGAVVAAVEMAEIGKRAPPLDSREIALSRRKP